MKRLGISLYPRYETLDKDKAYITLAAKYGVKRIFSCLISSSEHNTADQIKDLYKQLTAHAHQYNMEFIVDVAPVVFEKLNILAYDMTYFHEIGVDGIRLDEGFNGHNEALMSYNPYGLKIEINASLGTKYLDYILSYKGNKENIITCHNFYPQKYTGLSYEHFKKCSEDIKKHDVPVAAFVSSQEPGTYGPWPVNEGLCTLEEHRFLPIDVQARHLFATGLVDDVIIANVYASEEELSRLAKINPNKLSFTIDKEVDLSEVEEKILYEHLHFVRGDMSEYMARSTMTRITFANESIPPKNTRDLKRGDVVILNDQYGRYKGEMHIILKDMPNEGNKNVIGHIANNERMLLDFIEPWVVFEFIK